MSLKAFHIFFILASIVLAAWFGFWALPDSVWMGSASFVTAGLLTVYLFWFVVKLKALKRT